MANLTNLTALFSTLISANHILSQQGILDAYGHISVRNPNNASTFFLARDLAPALVASPTDIVEYRTIDAQPVATNAPSGYVERYIHSETLKRWPGVNSVIHSHVEDVILFGVSGVPFKAVGQDGSVLGKIEHASIFDIADYFRPSDPHVLVVTNTRLGAALASTFSNVGLNDTFVNDTNPSPIANVVLMTGHGMAVVGPDIITAVFRAISTRNAAQEEVASVELATLGNGDGQPRGNTGNGMLQYLTKREVSDIVDFGTSFYNRAWELWVAEAEAAAKGRLYQNTLGSPPAP